MAALGVMDSVDGATECSGFSAGRTAPPGPEPRVDGVGAIESTFVGSPALPSAAACPPGDRPSKV
jgi:hypothetical protein